MIRRVASMLLVLSACGQSNEVKEDRSTSYIAVVSDFAPYRTWTKQSVGSEPIAGHPAGERVIYVNQARGPGEVEFPVGTIIIKEMRSSDVETEWAIHAMVKRGPSFNTKGAVGWEWFDLKLNERSEPVTIWRGFEPPEGEGYGTLLGGPGSSDNGDCNSCHQAVADNDYVHTLK